MRARVFQHGIWGKVILAAGSALVFSLLLDRGLLLLGYPSRPPIPSAHPANFSELRTNVEFQQDFTTNSQGLRYDDIPFTKPPGSCRIFVVGDSFTEGVGVEVADRFTERLQEYFRRDGRPVAFINGGLAGRGPLEYARVFLKVGLKYDLDGLLVVISANDVGGMIPTTTPLDITSETPVDMYPDVDQPFWYRALQYLWPRAFTQLRMRRTSREYHNRTQPRDFVKAVSDAGVRAGIAPDRIERWKASLPERLVAAVNKGAFNGSLLSAALLYPTLWTDTLDIDTPLAERKWQAMTSVLTAMVSAARQHALPVGVVFAPVRFQYDLTGDGDLAWVRTHYVIREAWLSGHTEAERRLKAWANDLGLPFLDLTDSFREAAKTRRDLNWPLDGHWTPAGHRVASLAMYQWITTQHVFNFQR